MQIPNPHPVAFLDGKPHDCHITRKTVLIDGTAVPGHIAPGGVTVEGGGYGADGESTLPTVTVTFIVGAVEIDDDAVHMVEVHLPRSSKLD